MRETWVPFLGQEDPLEKEMATHPVFLPGEFHRGAWQATAHGVARVRYDLATKPPPPPQVKKGFPGGLDGKEGACNAGDLGSIPGLGRSPGEGKGYPFQYVI